MNEKTPLQQCLSPRMLRQSLIVSLVVGSILTIINQGDAMLAGHLNMVKVVLTYIVPFLVSTYGAWNMARVARAARMAMA